MLRQEGEDLQSSSVSSGGAPIGRARATRLYPPIDTGFRPQIDVSQGVDSGLQGRRHASPAIRFYSYFLNRARR